MSEPLGKSQVLEYLKYLSEEYEMYLHTFEKDTSEKTINEIQSIMDGYNIKWSYQPYDNKFGLFSTIGQMLSSSITVYRKVKVNRINIIHARSNIPALIALITKYLTGVKVIFDIRGFQIDEKAEIGRLKKGGLLYKFLKKIELLAYKRSNAIVSLTENAKQLISNVTNEEKIVVIPTCANKDVFRFSPDESFKLENGYSLTDRVIIHAGTVTNWYDFDSELLLVKQLMEKDSKIHFLILNKGEHSFISKKVEMYNIEPSKVKIKEADFYQMHKYLSIADASIFIIKPTFSKRASAPTKFAENLCCRLFSITNNNIGDMDAFIIKYPEVGFSFELDEIKNNIDGLSSEIIMKLQSSDKESKQYQELYDSHFTNELAVIRYSNLYKKLVNN